MIFEFFRRYQRVVFVCVTIVIIISFSFFGTFQTFMGQGREDTAAFTAVDGSVVKLSEVNDMTAFISSDIFDLFSLGIPWSGNCLNDGVIAHDLLQTQMVNSFGFSFLPIMAKEQQQKLDREKRYVPYKHPQASFLSAELLWAYYAPEVKEQFDLLRAFPNADSKEALQARIALFLAERKFPPSYLRQVLTLQQAQHKWLPQDPSLHKRDLSLFGYHNAQDWFGRQFVNKAAEFIINSAKIAEQRGYKVSKDEASMQLFQNAERAFKDAGGASFFGVATAGEFYQEQLRRLGMDQARAIHIWTQVMEFRRLFFENAESVLVSPLPFKEFLAHLYQYVDIDLYELPQECVFHSLQDARECSLYMNAVQGQKTLDLEKPFLAIEEVKVLHPELVQKPFTLRWVSLNKDLLQTKVSVRDLWQWQVQDENWQKLQAHFGELLKAPTSHVEERLSLLDSLTPIARSSVDNFSRAQIVDEHPEWIVRSLEDLPMKEEVVFLREKGGKVPPFEGVNNLSELIRLLERVSLDEQSSELAAYTQDGVFFFRIQVLDRSSPERVLTLKEAKADGTLAKLYEETLESAYPRIRDENPSTFINATGEPKPYSAIKEEVANIYFEPLERTLNSSLQRIQDEELSLPKDADSKRLASIFFDYVSRIRQKTADGQGISSFVQKDEEKNFEDQFKLIKARKRIVKEDASFPVDPTAVFQLANGTLSPVSWYSGGGPHFYTVIDHGVLPIAESLRQKVQEERELVFDVLLLDLAENLVLEMKKKNAFSLMDDNE